MYELDHQLDRQLDSQHYNQYENGELDWHEDYDRTDTSYEALAYRHYA